MRRSTAIAAVVALFLAGVLAGVLGTHLFYVRQARQPGGLVAVGTRLLAADLQRRLELTPGQREQVDGILADATRDAAAIRRQMTPRLVDLLERSGRRIEAVLTQEQRRELERYRGRNRERLRELLAP